MKYTVGIEEILFKEIEIEAESKEEAVAMIEKQYFNCEVVLTADDFDNVNFFVDASAV